MKMPKVDWMKLESLSEDEIQIVQGLIKKDDSIRASKPAIRVDAVVPGHFGFKVNLNNQQDAEVAYVWRMVVFMVSPQHQHQCMPVMAVYDLPDGEHNPRLNFLDKLIDKVVDAVDKTEWHGVNRWAKVL